MVSHSGSRRDMDKKVVFRYSDLVGCSKAFLFYSNLAKFILSQVVVCSDRLEASFLSKLLLLDAILRGLRNTLDTPEISFRC